jgi:hypothetical protein
MNRFAKFALPAALVFAAFGAQASEVFPASTASDKTAPMSAPAAAVNPAEVYFPSTVNRFEGSPVAPSSVMKATMKREGASSDLSYVGA